MYVYISGPYSLGDQALNVRAAVEAADAVMSAGHHPFTPHLSHFHHLIIPHGYEDWMTLDLAWLERCDMMIRLPGASPGADREVARAHELGIPVYYGVDSFLRAQSVQGYACRGPLAVIRGGAPDVRFNPDFALEEE